MSNIINEAKRETTKWEEYDTIKCPDGEIIDMQALLDEQAKAESACRHIAPAFGGFITKLRFVYTFQIETQATDGFNLFVNPQFTSHLTFEQKVAVMLHEVMHNLMNHLRRARVAGHTDHMKSNIAADYEVNGSLVDMGLIPERVWKEIHGFYDPKFSGKGYETIYDECNKSAQNSMKNQQQPPQQQGGQGQGDQQSDEWSQKSADYQAGWEQAMEDIASGKIKI